MNFDFLICSRIHITEVVRQHIGNDYEVEDGHGYARDKYLSDNGIKTYFVIADPKRVKHVMFFYLLPVEFWLSVVDF